MTHLIKPTTRRCQRNGSAPAADHMLSLAMGLRSPQVGRGSLIHALGVMGDAEGVGVSTVAADLAQSISGLVDGRVLLIDANTNHGASALFQLKPDPGLAEALTGELGVRECIQETEVGHLDLLAAGRMAASGFEPIKFAELIDDLKSEHDSIIVDLPPANGCYSGVSLAGSLDGIMLVLEAERTRIQTAQHIKELLRRAEAHVIGIVLNKQRQHVPKWLRGGGR